jgi:nicotinamidase/pyrazinamidase
MKKIVFWDVDTQVDFIEPTGKLYVPGAESILDNLAYITNLEKVNGRLCGSVDAHLPNDPEFDEWPEHCVYGTPGSLKVPESLANKTLYVPTAKLTNSQLLEVLNYPEQIIFEKQDNDVRTNPNVKPFLDLNNPDLVVIYGVVTEICVKLAVDFIARDLKYNTVVVSDAIKELSINDAERFFSDWESMNVVQVKTEELKNLI